jgi:hypothetical protein
LTSSPESARFMSHTIDNHDPRDPSQAPALADLPPIEAPSAGFIVQLFVIPAVVVAVVIIVWLLFGKLAGGERDAMEYVRSLRSPNANWRAAYELASLIRNDPKLSSDPKLLGELTDLLGHDLDSDQSPDLTRYVALTLGAFQTLDAQLPGGGKADPLTTLARALEPKQPGAVRIAAALSLAKHAARLDGGLDDPGAVAALGRAGEADDAELRQVAAYSLGFFGGDQAAGLLRNLLNDPDRFVRYNAAIALGRRGDPSSRGILREMLSTTDLNRVVKQETETETRSKVESIELEALQALQSSIDRGHPDLARDLRPDLTALGQSGLVSVRTKAQAVLKSLPPAP